jgi:hypothetical protein
MAPVRLASGAIGIVSGMSLPIHRRSYDCEAFEEGEGRMRVRGHLTDIKPLGLGVADGEPMTIHEMTIDLVVAIPEFEIVDVEADMQVHPYLRCTHVLDDYRKLIGESITRGYSRRVRELFGGPNGCSHMGALLQAMGPVAVQASWSLVNLHTDPADRVNEEVGDEERQRRIRLNADTCHVWADDGEHLAAVARGEAMSRPQWETDRLVQLGIDPGLG